LTDAGLFQQFMHADDATDIDLGDGGSQVPSLRKSVSSIGATSAGEITDLQTRVGNLETTAGEPVLHFASLTLLNADLAHNDGIYAYVDLDATDANNGQYRKSGATGVGNWVKTKDRVDAEKTARLAAEATIDTRLSAAEATTSVTTTLSGAGIYANQVLFDVSSAAAIVPLVIDPMGNILMGFDRTIGKFLMPISAPAELGAAISSALAPLNESMLLFSGDNAGGTPLVVDPSLNVLEDLSGGNSVSGGYDPTPLDDLGYVIPAHDWNVLIGDGQSLSIGGDGTPPLSVTQPWSNIGFNGGTRAQTPSTDMTSTIPLTENGVETFCSGAANYYSELIAEIEGGNPNSVTVAAATAGHGSYTLSQLTQGTAWYAVLQAQMTGFKALATTAGKTPRMFAMPWMQGESDAQNATDEAAYKAALIAFRTGAETDAQSRIGGTTPLALLMYQTPSYVTGNPQGAYIQRVQFQLPREQANFYHVSALYHLPFAAGQSQVLHLSNLGYLWWGHMAGRALYQLVRQGKKPAKIDPISVTSRGTELRIKFRVPQKPLVFDVDTLAVTTQMGFAVSDVDGDVPLSNIVIANGDTIVATLARTLAASPEVRYAQDFLGNGLTVWRGASGNLRDSTPDHFFSGGKKYPLFYVCPHFDLPITVLQ
jgi:hypothetical protein